jgi:chemotaxis protein CheX
MTSAKAAANPDVAMVTLPAVIDVASVAAVRDQIQQHRGSALEVDASAVERIGGLGIQVLLAASAAWASDGQPFIMNKPSSVLNETLRLTGASIEGMHS